MQFVSIREFRANTAKMWRKLKREKHIVVTSRGKPMAVMMSTDENRIADTLMEVTRQEAREALKSIQDDAEARGLSGMSMEQIDDIIAESRRERRGRTRASK